VRTGALIALAVVFVVAGCGGDGGGNQTAEAWADDVCTSIASWRTEIQTIVTNATTAVTSPGATRDDVENAVDDGVDATKTVIGDLRSSVPPDTPDGAEAKADLDVFVDELSATKDEVETTLASLPDSAGLTQVVTKLGGLATKLNQVVASGTQLVTTLTQVGGDIKDAFENADACQELREPEK
jgi:ABC-type transporter Mla subunit MlaD